MARVEVRMPQMGESLTEGTVIEWHKQPGDTIELDESLLEIGTDKVDTDVPSPVAGVLSEILVPEGETVEVGTVIAVIESDVAEAVDSGDEGRQSAEAGSGAAAREAPASAPTAVPAPPSEPAAAPAPRSEPAAAPVTRSEPASAPVPAESGDGIPRQVGDGKFFSPLVRSIAEKEGLSHRELAGIPGSGRDGRITKKDVLGYLQTRTATSVAVFPAAAPVTTSVKILSPSAPVPPKASGERVTIEKMDRIRQLISEHMTRSKATSAHVTSFAEVDVTNLVMLRERNKEAFFQREGVKLTYTPFFVLAAVEALRDHPILNASVVGDEIHYKKDYHIGIAVALGKTGLIVPVIRDAGQKNLVGLAHAAANVADRARNKQLMPDDLQGGTFTVTNVGSLGSIMGTPIINQPQVGILATGTIQKRPVVIENTLMGDTIGIRSMMFLSLSYDHRVVDGAMGASFLSSVVEVLRSFDPNEVIR